MTKIHCDKHCINAVNEICQLPAVYYCKGYCLECRRRIDPPREVPVLTIVHAAVRNWKRRIVRVWK